MFVFVFMFGIRKVTNIIMLLRPIHDKDFFFLNDSTRVEYTFKQNIVDVVAIYSKKINKTSVVLLTL